MRAAIYARRSTEDHQAESLDTQIDNARRFLAERGWSEVATFVDDGISRAEFRRRTGLLALLNKAGARAFDLVITRDESRLGGDMLRTGLVLQDLADHGVRIWYYATREEVRLDDATQRFLVAARNFSSELEREKISSRTRENLERKARRGLVAGGVVFGYDNARGPEGVRRVVNAGEAAIVREMFERAARGEGLRAIAHALNAAGVRPPRRGRLGWAPSAINAILRRPLYAGRVEWGRTHKTYKGGTKVRLSQHAQSLVTGEAPELRIVPEELWASVQTRGERHRVATGGARKGRPARYLLTGISRCLCGGPMQVERQKKSYQNLPAYQCGYHRDRGATVCRNTLRRPVAVVDAAIVAWVRANVLSEPMIAAVLRRVRARLDAAADQRPAELDRLTSEAARVRGEISRLTLAIASGSMSVDALVKAIQEREARRRVVESQLELVRMPPRIVQLASRRFEERARARLDNLAELLAEHPTEGRRVLQALLVGPLRWTPITTSEGPRYEIRGEATIGRVLLTEGAAKVGVESASPAGFEPA